MTSILASLKLTEPQRTAATLRDVPVVVTAGAGSGKTRALVGRYLSLLEDGLPLRSILAITFTDKAAREMRTRIRQQIGEWLAMDAPGKEQWQAALADLDAARTSRPKSASASRRLSSSVTSVSRKLFSFKRLNRCAASVSAEAHASAASIACDLNVAATPSSSTSKRGSSPASAGWARRISAHKL